MLVKRNWLECSPYIYIIYYVLIHNGTQTFVYYCSMEYHWGLVTFRYHMIDDSTVLQ